LKEETRAKAGLVYNVVESVILAMTVGLNVWLASLVIVHGNVLASHGTQIGINTDAIIRYGAIGTPGLATHEGEDKAIAKAHEERIQRLEQTVIAFSELKGIAVEIRGLHEGQLRIEEALKEHLKKL
jgi:hypothetical protein